MLDEKPKDKWYFKTSTLVIAFLGVGPLALPLVWFNPRFKTITKIAVTFIVIILTYYLWIVLKPIIKNYQELYNGFLGQATL